ncbi:uncharacterized protein LOC124161070 isoform X2 [Ischnura elegans]|uniref:uncharacterized protein LOC124161070 isoform X2 n=1 Tax=Ischnura elegans TaxID=197161 RepID=UPI001ED873A9|nr:uncharacterized protein LOC124161070 isoform X2 [Ischnura elegans]
MPSRGGGVRLARQSHASMRPPTALSSRSAVCTLAVEPATPSSSAADTAGSPQPMVEGSPTPPPQHTDRRLAAALMGEPMQEPSRGFKAQNTRSPSPTGEPSSNGLAIRKGAVIKEELKEREGDEMGGGVPKTEDEDGGAGMDLKDAPEVGSRLGNPATPGSHTGYSGFARDGGEAGVDGVGDDSSVVDERGMVLERVGPGSGAVGVEDPWGEGADAPPGGEDNQLTTLTAVDTMDCTNDVTVEGVAYAARGGDPSTTDGGVVAAPGGHFGPGGGGTAGDPPSVLVIGGGHSDNRKIVGLEDYITDDTGSLVDQRGRVLPGGGYVHIGSMMGDGVDEFISGDVGDDSVVVVLGPDGRVTESIRLGDMHRISSDGPRETIVGRPGAPLQVTSRGGRLPSIAGLGATSSVVRSSVGVGDGGKQPAVRLPPFERTVIQRSSNHQQQQLCDSLALGQAEVDIAMVDGLGYGGQGGGGVLVLGGGADGADGGGGGGGVLSVMHGGGDQQIVTTVLVLSEEEFNQSLGKRKELVGQGDVEEAAGAEFAAGADQPPHPRSAAPPPRAPMSSAAAAAAAQAAAAASNSSSSPSGHIGQGGRSACPQGDIASDANGNQGGTGPGGQGSEEETWSRSYYEHPLTAATAAMLNIGGGCGVGGTEDQVSSPAGATMGFIYEYYKLPVLPLSAGSGDKDKDKLVDVWPTTSASLSGGGSVGGALMTSAPHGKQSANGLSPGGGLGPSSDLLHPPPSLVPVSLHQSSSATPSPSPASPHHHQHHVVHHGHHHQHQQHQQQHQQQQQLHHAPDLGIFLSANEESDNFGGQGGGNQGGGGGTDGEHLHPQQHHGGHQFGGSGSSPSHHFSPHLHQGSQSPQHHHLQHHHPHLHSTHHYLSVKREPEDLSQPVSLARASKGGDGRVGTPSPLLEQQQQQQGSGGGSVHALKERAKAAAAAAGISIVVNGGGASSPGGCVKEEPNGVGNNNRPCSASSAASSVLVDQSSELVVVTADGLKGGVVMSGGGGGGVVVSAPPKGGSTSNPSTPSSSSSPGAPSQPSSYSIFANIGSGHHQQGHQSHQQQHQQFVDHVTAAPHQYGLVPNSQGYSLTTAGGGNGGGNNVVSNLRTTSSSSSSSTSSSASSTPAATTAYSLVAADPYYRDYFGDQYQVRQQVQYADSPEGGGAPAASFVERYVRQGSVAYKSNPSANPAAPSGGVGLTVDLPSPDSGIGADAITPRDQTTIQQAPLLGDPALTAQRSSAGGAAGAGGGGANGAAAAAAAIGAAAATPGVGGTTPGGRSRPWHDFGRQNDADKVQIPKVFSLYGFKYFLETPISTSQRREDDRITYINKGQFYGISLEYSPDPDRPALKSQTVKSVVMLMFREEKSPEDEIKAWQFWHGRQHSVKQRILDADTKNSVGLIGCIEEVAHNAIAVYWNPMESSAKINVAVQCLSTDFSSQKGVKGLPLHLQIDTYEDPRETTVYHRAYCQIKVFCDKGAERKTRDEERRAAKRKMTATGRKKMDELYHPVCERSEFYAMADLGKPPVLFSPAEDIDKLTSMELQGFYGHDTDNSSLSNGEAGTNVLHHVGTPGRLGGGGVGGGGGGGLAQITAPSSSFLLHTNNKQSGTTLKFHNHFPPEGSGDKKDSLESLTGPDGVVFPAIKRPKMGAHSPHLHPNSPHHVGHVTSPHHHHLHLHPHHLGPQHTPLGPPPPPSGGGSPALPPPLPPPPMQPPLSERVMLYVRQETDNVYTPLHVVPPSAAGLLNAIENKYKISTSSISNLYRKNKKGIMAKIDDDMLKYYCNEDLFILDIKPSPDGEDTFDITLTELMD